MKAQMNNLLGMGAELNESRFGSIECPGFACGDGLTVTVIFTDRKGTQAALRMASNLAKGLDARIRFLVAEGVPFHFPLDSPPVSPDFLERRHLQLISESELDADEVRIEIFLCRSRKECLRQVLRPGSLVVVGGRSRCWLNEARTVERWLCRLGHHVIFADVRRSS